MSRDLGYRQQRNTGRYDDYELTSSQQDEAISIHFRFKPYGWATFLINNKLGTFCVQSDWGDWAYRWPSAPKYLGHPNLLAALRDSFNSDYVANKILKGERDEYDPDGTEKHFKGLLLKARRALEIDKAEAREAWYQAGRIDWSDQRTAVEQMYEDEVLNAIAGSEPWYEFQQRETSEYIVFTELLYPTLVAHLKENHPDVSHLPGLLGIAGKITSLDGGVGIGMNSLED